MYEFYLFSLIGSLALLVIWQTFGKSKSMNRLFGILFLVAIISYAISLFQLHLLEFYSLKIVFRDLMMLSLGSFISIIVRKTKLGIFLWMILAGILIYFLNQDREILLPKDFELDQNNELFIKLNSENAISEIGLLDFLQKENITFERAFELQYPTNTQLDNYYTLNLVKDNSVYISKVKRKLKNFKTIELIEENETINVSPLASETIGNPINNSNFNDPLSKDQWALTVLKINELNNLINASSTPNRKAKLFILDTGVDANHEDIKDNYVSVNPKYDTDVQSHGTHCAGIAGAVSNNFKGVSSLSLNNNLFSITGIKVLSDSGMGTQKTIINGIIEAAEKGADVISLSLGGRSTDKRQKLYEETVAYANGLGAIVVVAAGNSSMNAIGYSPANTKGVIAVSAIDENLNMATFSNSVEDLEMGISAPGVNILSTIPNNQYKAFNGTSMATPHVAALAAILKSFQPNLTTREVFDLMNNNGQDIQQSKSGNLIDPYNTLKRLVNK